ncbi:cupin domain-containing protein [Amorphus sp. 3PC139-8]|uniref:cupin domain-containing protein n=1 Tax=Amorphus sp. 3PC139-8 TaxID=2735676 RepID=UPI00345DB494
MAQPAGITRAPEAYDGAVWNILGQTYVLKEVDESSMAWHATFPSGTFVPPHIHPTQDEFIYMFEGTFDIWLDGQDMKAGPGDLIRMPRGLGHGIFNNSSSDVTCFFWVSPARELRQLFERIHNVPDPAEVVRIAAEHEVDFLPPPTQD